MTNAQRNWYSNSNKLEFEHSRLEIESYHLQNSDMLGSAVPIVTVLWLFESEIRDLSYLVNGSNDVLWPIVVNPQQTTSLNNLPKEW